MKFCPNLHFMYREHPFLDRFAAAAADGFKAVEICFAYDVGLNAVTEALTRSGQRLVSFNFPAGQLISGKQRGLASIPGREEDFMAQIEEGFEWARALDCRQAIMPLAGMMAHDADAAAHHATLIANLKAAAPLAQAAGVTLLVEPNNTVEHPGYFLRFMAQVRDIVDAVAAPNVRLLFDTYHTQLMEGRLTDNFLKHEDLIAHVQVGNVPGRHEPDRGEIDHAYLFAVMREAGYDGWIAGEYFPAGATRDGLAWLDKMGFARP